MIIAAEESSASWLGPTVAVTALFFTVFSFWWIQVRRGNLRSYPPKSYAGAFLPDKILLSFPLVMYNTGPAPIVVRDLRLRIALRPGRLTDEHNPNDDRVDERSVLPMLLYWHALQPELEPAKAGGGRVLPSPFPVEGRKALQKFVEFQWRAPRTGLEDGPYEALIEAQLAHRSFWRWLTRKGDWHTLVKFPLHSELANDVGRIPYTSRTNDPGWRS